MAHIERIIEANEKLNEQRHAAAQQTIRQALDSSAQAITKAELAAEKRFDSVNEFRATLADQQRLLITRSEVTAMLATTMDRVELVMKQIEHLQSERMGIKGGWGYAVGAIGLVLAVVSIVKMLSA